MTYSIVGADLEAGEVGCAVQSKYFAVGAVVPWAKAGVGAVATQAAGVAAYGLRVLEQLEAELAERLGHRFGGARGLVGACRADADRPAQGVDEVHRP